MLGAKYLPWKLDTMDTVNAFSKIFITEGNQWLLHSGWMINLYLNDSNQVPSARWKWWTIVFVLVFQFLFLINLGKLNRKITSGLKQFVKFCEVTAPWSSYNLLDSGFICNSLGSFTENYSISFITHERNKANASVMCTVPKCLSLYSKEEEFSL